MARKLPAFQRILGPQAIVSIVYGEISSSLYFALGIVALWALGLTPLVLLGVGVLFGLAAWAYAEGATAVDEPGGSTAIVRRAFGDLAGFIVGWAVVLDFMVVIGLSLLFVPHYLLAAVGQHSRLDSPTDEVIAVLLVLALGGFRLVRRSVLYSSSWIVAGLDLAVQLLLALLGVMLVFDPDRLTRTLDVGVAPTWNAVAYSVPIAMVSFAGIEIVATLLRETKQPGQALARDTVLAIVATIVVYAVLAVVALSAFPVEPVAGAPSGYASAVSTTWLSSPLAGVAQAIGDDVGAGMGGVLRAVTGFSGVLILLLNATTAFSGATRVLRALAEAASLPPMFAHRGRRTQSSAAATVLVTLGVVVLFPIASLFDQEVTGLVTIYAFGILLAFMAVFLAVVWLRFTAPDLPRPLRMRGNVGFGDVQVPVFALVGFGLAWGSWLVALGTHEAIRVVPPIWLALGLVTFAVTRRVQGRPLLSRYRTTPPPPPEVTEVPYGTILVPLKQAGPIEEEMLATAAKLAQAQGARVLALKVIEVPMACPIDVEDAVEERLAAEAMRLAEQFGPDYGVEIDARAVRGRAISSTISKVAREEGVGLILVGAVPRKGAMAGRAQIFSETIENLLRRAPCRVIVTAFPPGTASVAPPEEAAV